MYRLMRATLRRPHRKIMIPTEGQPKCSTLEPTRAGPTTCPILLPCMVKPMVTGMAAAVGAIRGTEDTIAAGIKPPRLEKLKHSSNDTIGVGCVKNKLVPHKTIPNVAMNNKVDRETPAVINVAALRLPVTLAKVAKAVK